MPCELPELCEELLVSGMLAPAISPESGELVLLLSKSPLSPDEGVCPLLGIDGEPWLLERELV